MARLQKESGESMSFRLQEISKLEERIVKDELRMNEISEMLIERDLLEHLKETDDLIQEWHNLNSCIEQCRNRLALLKAPSEQTEEDKERLPKGSGTSDRYNITY